MTSQEYLLRPLKAYKRMDALQKSMPTRNTQQLAESLQQIQVYSCELSRTKLEVQQAIERLDNSLSKDILTARYIDFMSWSAIANKLHMSERNIHRLHKKIVDLEVKQCETT